MDRINRIEALVDVLGRFGKELCNVRELIGDIEIEVKKHTSDLKQELNEFKKSLQNKENLKAFDVEEIDSATKEETTLKISPDLSNLSTVINIYSNGFGDGNSNLSDEDGNKLNPNASEWLSPLNFTSQQGNQSYLIQKHLLAENQWQTLPTDEELQEIIDWSIEKMKRENMKHYLMVKEGWMHLNSSVEKIEKYLREVTGKLITWSIESIGKDKYSGKLLLKVKFDNVKDCKYIYARHKDIGQEGHILIGEALTQLERKERWKMLKVAEKLQCQGYKIEFENKRICIDGTWWKYKWQCGWELNQDQAPTI